MFIRVEHFSSLKWSDTFAEIQFYELARSFGFTVRFNFFTERVRSFAEQTRSVTEVDQSLSELTRTVTELVLSHNELFHLYVYFVAYPISYSTWSVIYFFLDLNSIPLRLTSNMSGKKCMLKQ